MPKHQQTTAAKNKHKLGIFAQYPLEMSRAAVNQRAQTANAAQQVVQQGVTSLQARPTDINIPKSIDKIVPEVELYRKLLEAEKRLDVFTARRFNDLQENLAKIPFKKQVLRIFIYNTALNQPWQQQPGQQTSDDPIWTLRIEGRLANKDSALDPARKKFSSFLSGISIDLLPNVAAETPLLQQQKSDNIVEWNESNDPNTSRVDFDGLDVKRSGSENIKTKITIQPKEFPIKFKASPELSSLLGVSQITQHEALYSIWHYIQFNNLQASEDKRVINCDDNLVKLFGVPRFDFKDLIELLNKHLSPNDPIEIEYEIRVDKATTLGDVVVDIEVSLDDVEEQESWKEESKKLAELDETIKELNSKIVLGIQGLHNSHRKYQFYEKLSKDPVNFIEEFVDSHSKLLKILSGDEGYTEAAVRRSDFYTDDMLSENINFLAGTNRL